MPVPMLPVKLPADLSGSHNGKLWPSQVAPINLPGIGVGNLHKAAVDAFNCLFLVAKQETGQTITATSLGDAYRSYDMQKTVFLQRFSPTLKPGSSSSSITRIGPDGKTWYIRLSPGGQPFAPVAGFLPNGEAASNHGWGLALDCQLWDETNHHGMGLNSNALFWAWLSAPNTAPSQYRIGTGSNAESFGLSWELIDEPWHLRLSTGGPTQRVTDLKNFFDSLNKPK